MSQYKPDGVNYPVVTVVNGSNAVIIQGVDATLEIGVGDYFFVQGDNGRYEVNAAAIVYSGGNTTLHLTTNYAGTSSTTAIGVFHRDFTVNLNLPLIQVNDLQAAELMARALNLIDAAVTTPTVTGDLTFSGLGRRIKGDFSNATIANRLSFQTTTLNGSTSIHAIPNGTGTTSQISFESDSAATNGSIAQFGVVGGADTRIQSNKRGSGTFLPMTFYTSGVEKMRIGIDGKVGIGVTAPAYMLDIAGESNDMMALRMSNATDGPVIRQYRQMGTIAAPTAIVAADISIGGLRGFGWTSAPAYSGPCVSIGFRTAEAFTATAQGAYIDFYTTPIGTVTPLERMRINPAGFVGIGITPTTKLQVAAASNTGFMVSSTDGTTLKGIFYNTSDNQITIGTVTNHPIAFFTNNTERMRIDSGGFFRVNTTTDRTGVISLDHAGSARYGIAIQNTDTGATNQNALVFTRGAGATGIGSISTTNTATQFNTSSDYRLKDNQKSLTGSGKFIDALKPKIWQWACDGSRGVGFIAHEVQEVSPSSVTGLKDAEDENGKPIYQSMEYGSGEFIANIIAELQSLRKRVAELENK